MILATNRRCSKLNRRLEEFIEALKAKIKAVEANEFSWSLSKSELER